MRYDTITATLRQFYLWKLISAVESCKSRSQLPISHVELDKQPEAGLRPS